MHVTPFEDLACPIDGLHLTKCDNQLKCPNNHCFDIARQRYVNLLPIQDKRSKQPGDSKEMTAARRRFLDSGIYSAISDKVNELVLLQAKGTHETFNILDAGCGEGYYLAQLCQTAQEEDSTSGMSLLGVDISKPAIVSATQRNRQDITWAVATNRKLPVLEHSVDLLLCMFGFPVFDVFKHCLKHSGAILLVESGPKHLIELRDLIYDEVRMSGLPSHENAIKQGFNQVSEETLCINSGALTAEQRQDLLVMTPHFFKAKPEKRDKISKITELSVTIDVRFRLFTLSD